MKAVVWHGDEDVRVDSVAHPRIEQPTDAIVRITSTAICGSDLHLYGAKVLGMKEGDILGHEPDSGIPDERRNRSAWRSNGVPRRSTSPTSTMRPPR
jgi:threonine dehydrogenase-like Zn-dependent dehydrogenase